MSQVLAIDPGNDLGWALFEDGQLIFAGLNNPSTALLDGARAIIERPQVYRSSQSKGDPNDLITLAIGVGQMKERLESRGVQVDLVLPTTWKGQTPKEIHHKRVLARLSPTEKTRLDGCLSCVARGVRHNVLDAVGLGLWFLRRGR